MLLPLLLNLGFAGTGLVSATHADRTITIVAESRTVTPRTESRTVTIISEGRTVTIKGESRTVTPLAL